MSDFLKEINDKKTSAKNRRDLRRYDRAAALLKQAIDLADHEYSTTNVPEWRATVVSELADCWGILGGVERRWALDPNSDAEQRTTHLRQSISAYDKGFEYESSALPGSASTYNRLNRLISRLLLNPERLVADGNAADQEPGRTVNVRAELTVIRNQIEQDKIESVWTAADFALLNVLLGRQDAASAYSAFEKMQVPDFACQSALDVVAPLAAVDLVTAGELKNAEKRLTALLSRLLTH